MSATRPVMPNLVIVPLAGARPRIGEIVTPGVYFFYLYFFYFLTLLLTCTDRIVKKKLIKPIKGTRIHGNTSYEPLTTFVRRTMRSRQDVLFNFGSFLRKFGCHGNSLGSLEIFDSIFEIADPENPTIHTKFVSISCTEMKLCRGIKHGDFCCFKGVTYVALTLCFKLRSLLH